MEKTVVTNIIFLFDFSVTFYLQLINVISVSKSFIKLHSGGFAGLFYN